MTALTSFLPAFYLVGIAWLLLLDAADRIHLAPLVAAVREVATRRYHYVGRHWANGLSTMQQVDKARAERAELAELAGLFSEVVDLTHTVIDHRRSKRRPAWDGPTISEFLPEDKSDVGPYAPKAGVGAYVHLRQDELDALAERDARWLKPHAPVDLDVLRVRTSTMPRVEEHDDEWAAV